jgi:hypothetical protein
MKRKTFADDLAALRDVPRHMLYHDGVNTVFVLTKHMEIFHYGNGTLMGYIFDRKEALRFKLTGVIFNDRAADDGLIICEVDRRNLPIIIQTGRFIRRPHLNGRWLRDKKARLGHDIFPFNSTELFNTEEHES